MGDLEDKLRDIEEGEDVRLEYADGRVIEGRVAYSADREEIDVVEYGKDKNYPRHMVRRTGTEGGKPELEVRHQEDADDSSTPEGPPKCIDRVQEDDTDLL